MHFLSWVIFACAPGDLQFLRSGLWVDGQEGQILGSPIALAGDGKNTYVLDQSDFKIKVFDPDGEQTRQFGNRGQGPGEFELPVSIAYLEHELWVYDGNKGAVLKFTPDGKFMGTLRLMRGYELLFFADGLLLQAVFDKYLFHRYDSNGEKRLSFCEGFTKVTGIFEAYDLIAKTCLDEANGLFYAFYQHGRFFEVYRLVDGVLLRKQNLDLERFTAKPQKRSELNQGMGVFVMENGQPVKGVVKTDRDICLLIRNENAEELSYLGILGDSGEFKLIQPTPSFFTDMFYSHGIFTFTNREAGTLFQYRIEIPE